MGPDSPKLAPVNGPYTMMVLQCDVVYGPYFTVDVAVRDVWFDDQF